MSWWKDQKRNPPPNGEQDQLPCPAPAACRCVWTWRDTRWVKGDDNTDCPVHS